MEKIKRTSASMEGNENEGFTFPCSGFEKMSEMMGPFFKDEKGSFNCGEIMKKCCGGKNEPFDFRRMMKEMCGISHGNSTRK